jgi:hypothetical protein
VKKTTIKKIVFTKDNFRRALGIDEPVPPGNARVTRDGHRVEVWAGDDARYSFGVLEFLQKLGLQGYTGASRVVSGFGKVTVYAERTSDEGKPGW